MKYINEITVVELMWGMYLDIIVLNFIGLNIIFSKNKYQEENV